MNQVLEKMIKQTTVELDIEEFLLRSWLDQHNHLPANAILNLLYLAKKHHLDPLADEVSVTSYLDGTVQAYISIDGWSKLINQHPQYGGMSLRDATELLDGIPVWVECTIYRNDRILPIIIKEYFDEVKTDHISWQRMPRRMLRHRVIQQCARLAFGISATDILESRQATPFLNKTDKFKNDAEVKPKKSRCELLKEQLHQ